MVLICTRAKIEVIHVVQLHDVAFRGQKQYKLVQSLNVSPGNWAHKAKTCRFKTIVAFIPV